MALLCDDDVHIALADSCEIWNGDPVKWCLTAYPIL